jgi:PAS domain S-box-containing protein
MQAKDRYRDLVEEAPVPIFVVKEEGAVYCNKKAMELTSYEEKEKIYGEDPVKNVAEEHRDKLRKQMGKILAGENTSESPGVYKFFKDDGTETYVEVNGSRIMYNGDPAIQASFRDVTEEKRVKKELERKNSEIQSILETLPVGVVATHEDGEIKFVNQKFTKTFDIDESREDIKGRNIEDLIGKVLESVKNSDKVEHKIRGMIESEKDEVEEKADLENGKTVRGKLKKVRTGEHEWNIWATRQVEETGQMQKKEVEFRPDSATQKLSEFTETVSKDLKNPVNIAKGYLDLIQDSEHDEEIREIENSLNQLEEIIDHLSYINGDSEVLDKKEISIRDTFKGSLDYFDREEIEDKVRGDQEANADPSALTTVFQNLIRNSTEYSEGEVTIEVGELEDGFYYQDDGPGVDEEIKDRIFEQGFTTEEENTGFGLCAVKKIAEAHGWKVEQYKGELGGLQIEFHFN